MSIEIQKVLEQSGLSEKEVKVYLALLELGSASVQVIARKADIKRPTTYLVLDELEQKGLVSVIPQKKALYTAESPERLIKELSKKQEIVKRFLPDLLALYNAKKDKPKVQLFQGEQGVKLVYQKIFESSTVDFYGTIQEVIKMTPESLEDFLKKVKEYNLPVREILTNSGPDLEYAKGRALTPNHQVRLLPSGMAFLTDSAIFGDHVVFFSFHPQIFCVMITSREISSSLKTLFELAWQAAQPAK
jgi:sugar-specific transcriptional regulator TrmB